MWDGMGLLKLEKEEKEEKGVMNVMQVGVIWKRDMRALILVLLEWYYWSSTRLA